MYRKDKNSVIVNSVLISPWKEHKTAHNRTNAGFWTALFSFQKSLLWQLQLTYNRLTHV